MKLVSVDLWCCFVRFLPMGAVLGGLFFVAPVVSAQPAGVRGYEATVLEPLPTGDWTHATLLDDLGRVVGRSTGDDPQGPVVWVNGAVIELPVPPDLGFVREQGISPTTGVVLGHGTAVSAHQPVVWTIDGTYFLPLMPGLEECLASGINDAGWIVGGCFTFNFGRPALWIKGNVPIDLGDLGGGQAATKDINEQGWIIGCSSRADDPFRHCWPVIWKPNGEMIDLLANVPGKRWNESGWMRAINNHGEIIGEGQGIQAIFHWRDGVFTALPPLQENCGQNAWAINDQGLIVGFSAVGDNCIGGIKRAVVWEERGNRDFQIIDLSDVLLRQENILLHDAKDINNAGQIAATGELETGEERGFLVTPYQFDLAEPVPGVAGKINTITVTGLAEGQRVVLIFGTMPGAQPIGNGCLGGLVLIRDANTHRSLEVLGDANGNATFRVLVPKGVAGKTVRYQVIGPDECEISHTVEWKFE